jgi:hypothetical protein
MAVTTINSNMPGTVPGPAAPATDEAAQLTPDSTVADSSTTEGAAPVQSATTAKTSDVLVGSGSGPKVSFQLDNQFLPPGQAGSDLKNFIEDAGNKALAAFGEPAQAALGELKSQILSDPQKFMTDGKFDIDKIKDAMTQTFASLTPVTVTSQEFNTREASSTRQTSGGENPASTRQTTGGQSPSSTRQTSGADSTRQTSGADSTRQTSGADSTRQTGASGPSTTISSQNYAVLNIGDADISALCFMVLMEAAKSAKEDLKAIMANVKSINNAKAQQRQNLQEAQAAQSKCSSKTAGQSVTDLGIKTEYAKATVDADPSNPKGFLNNSKGYVLDQSHDGKVQHPTKSDVDTLVEKMKGDLDSMSEMGETESLRLQMAMDRLSKMMSTLSNILKKISDTGQSITQNMK